ncbi:MAG TPA: hypothetical protein VM053_06140 [Gemmatimonadaceae bacterium]|nr:hypothetical protein [Gemmatimonadaceae bacterium]
MIERAAIVGVLIVALTEGLSLAHLLTQTVALIVWIPAAVFALYYAVAHRGGANPWRRWTSLAFDERLAISAIAFTAATNLFLALVAAPSAWDALGYHAPRISHWIQNASIAPYPTHIDRQIWISPGAEFFALQLQLITGSNRFMNMVQWLSSVGCVVVASQLATELGAARKGQILAAVAAATLPMGIAQASGSQADLFAAFWIAASIVLLLRLRSIETVTPGSAAILGACVGLSVLAKGTAYVILLPFILWCSVSAVRRLRFKALPLALITIVIAIGINVGHYSRTYEVFGNPFTNPRAPGVVNESVTPAVVVSNIARNIGAHTGSPVPLVNKIQQSVIVSLHSAMGLSHNDPRTSFSNTHFAIVTNAQTEEMEGNFLHLALLFVVFVSLLIRWRSSTGTELAFALCLASGFLLFCIVLKWQPLVSRLHVPFFIIGAGLIGCVLERSFGSRWLRIVALLLFVASLPILLRNKVRPVVARTPIFRVPLEQRYFIETSGIYEPSVAAGELISSRNCRRIGLITSWADHEELLWVVLRNRISGPFEILNVGVTAAEYPPLGRMVAREPAVCAVVTQYAQDLFKPKQINIPPGFFLALDRGPIKVYLPSALPDLR